jgi:hypothetical protein
LNRLLTGAALAAAALALAACASSSTSARSITATRSATHPASSAPAAISGTETLSATDTGAAAAANLNNQSSSAPLSFSVGTLAGPVAATIKPLDLTGNAPSGTQTWETSAGKLTVFHQSTDPAGSKNTPPPATWTLAGKTCHFTAKFDYGIFHQVGDFGTNPVATAWHGTYVITAEGYAPLKTGKTSCSFDNTGLVEDSGASIVFAGTGTMAFR